MVPTSKSFDDRIDLLSHAIDLCRSLSAALRTLGPTISLDVVVEGQRDVDQDGFGEQEKRRHIRSLEQGLDKELRSVLEGRNQVLAPISRVTDDILRAIFLSNNDEDTSDIEDYMDYLEGLSKHAFTVSSVCRQWRAVALQTAPLWSYLVLRCPSEYRTMRRQGEPYRRLTEKSRRYEANMVEVQQASLIRSSNAWLTVYIELRPAHLETLSRAFSQICAGTTLPSRVKELTICCSYGADRAEIEFLGSCLYQARHTLTRLRLIWLHGVHLRPNEVVELNRIFLTALPVLEEADITDLFLPSSPNFTILTSCRTLKFRIKHESKFSLEAFRLLLRTCSQLEVFAIDVLHGVKDALLLDPPPFKPIPMPVLRSLTVNQSRDISFPFTLLCAPALRRLTVTYKKTNSWGPSDGGPLIAAAIFRMLEVSACQLNLFSSTGLHSQHVCPIVSRMALYIEEIEFHSETWGDIGMQYLDIFSLLRTIQGTDDFARLQTLKLGFHATPTDMTALLDLLQHRRDHASPVKKVHLKGWDHGRHEPDTSPILEEQVASLLESFTVGEWHFNKEKRTWEENPRPFGVKRSMGSLGW